MVCGLGTQRGGQGPGATQVHWSKRDPLGAGGKVFLHSPVSSGVETLTRVLCSLHPAARPSPQLRVPGAVV